MPRPKRGIHDHLLGTLEERIISRGRYDVVSSNLKYHRRGYDGEFDLYARRRVNGKNFYTYYEVKSRYSRVNRHTARQQFERVLRAFPHQRWRFVLVTPTRVQREYL